MADSISSDSSWLVLGERSVNESHTRSSIEQSAIRQSSETSNDGGEFLASNDENITRLTSNSSGPNTSSGISGETVESVDLGPVSSCSEDASRDQDHDELGPLPEIHRQVSGSSGGISFASSAQRFAEPGQTLIFFDWDDTLFPTTEIFERWKVPAKRKHWNEMCLPEGCEALLEAWREALHQYISVACSLSDRCTIVTSSSPGWVESCIEHFAPNLKPLFDRSHTPRGPQVVYAIVEKEVKEASVTRTSLSCLTEAKLVAMRSEATEFYSRYPQQTWKNILSLGDMKYEHDALQELACSRSSIQRERLKTKAILLPRKAALSEITLRLKFSRLMLPVYVQYKGDIDLDLRTAVDPLQAIARAVGMPQLEELPFPRHAWGRTPMPEGRVADEALDEVALAVHELLLEEMESPRKARPQADPIVSSSDATVSSSSRRLRSNFIDAAMSLVFARLFAQFLARRSACSAQALLEVFHSINTLPVSVVASNLCSLPRQVQDASFIQKYAQDYCEVALNMMWLDCIFLGLENFIFRPHSDVWLLVRRFCQAIGNNLCTLLRRFGLQTKVSLLCGLQVLQGSLSCGYFLSLQRNYSYHGLFYVMCWLVTNRCSWLQAHLYSSCSISRGALPP